MKTIAFESYGAKVQIKSNDRALLESAAECARSSLLGKLREIDAGPYDVIFDLSSDGDTLYMLRNGEYLSSGDDERIFIKFFDSVVRISVAEYAKDLVFLHAGAVSWQGRGIVLPGNSFHGKSTFVTELVKAGAEYFSDDFAILDLDGRLHPFPRPISMRSRDGKFDTYDLDPHSLGSRKAIGAVPVDMIFITEYLPRARWRPRMLSPGEGVLESVPFALPLQRQPELCLTVLNRVAARAIIAKSYRGEAHRAAKLLIDFFESERK